MVSHSPAGGPGVSGGHGGQLDDGIVAQRGDRFQGHVAGPLHRPIHHFVPRRMAPTRRVIAGSLGKMPTTSVRRMISPLSRLSGFIGVERRPVILGEVQIGEDVGLGLVDQGGEFGHPSWSATWRH
jgi:hypothetical protein